MPLLAPAPITIEAIDLAGCPCRLEQLLRFPGLAATSAASETHTAAQNWHSEITETLQRMEVVETRLRELMSSLDGVHGYGIRITHAGSRTRDGARMLIPKLDEPVDLDMPLVLGLLADRLKEDAARMRGGTDARGRFVGRWNFAATAYSPQDRLLGKDDAFSIRLLAEHVSASQHAAIGGAKWRSTYALHDRQLLAALRRALPGWDRGQIADLIAMSCLDWESPPTKLAAHYRYVPGNLGSDGPQVRDDAKKTRARLMEWLREHDRQR